MILISTRPVLIALATALMALPRLAAAGEAPLALTLADAVARAEANSLRLAELRARVDAASAAEAGRQAADRPLVALRGGYMRTNHVDEYALALPGQPLRVLYPDVPDNSHARLDLQWPIYTAGRGGALERAAGAEREAATFDVAAARADLRLEGARAFWALVTAQETERVLSRAMASIDAHVRDLRSRLAQGLIPPHEVMSAEAERSRHRLAVLEAANRRGIADADLRRVIGEDTRRRIEPLLPAGMPDARSDEAADLLDRARTGRPERLGLAARATAAHEREVAAAAGGRPQIGIAAGYDYARPNPRIFPRTDGWRESWDVSVNVSWALWDGGRRRADTAEAAATARALHARATDFDRQLAFEVEQRRLEAASSLAAIETADEGVRAAVEARRVIGERFTAGVATSAEVLDRETAVLQAELDRTRAIANARLAAARLDRAVGK